jgi:pseudaminic acid cytidylyltransferase
MLILPSYRVQDIDTPEDWERAELIFQLLQRDESLARS